MSELFTFNEVQYIVSKIGDYKPIRWKVVNASDEIMGHLGEHLKLIVQVDANQEAPLIEVFVKCVPRFDELKATYLRKLKFFKKEFIMLSDIFKEFGGDSGTKKWRPKLLLAKEEEFVFEDVTQQGFRMPPCRNIMSLEEIKAIVISVARFHSQSYILEKKRSLALKRNYTLWEQYGDYLKDPPEGQNWRNAGTNGVIEFLKVYSKYKFTPNVSSKLESAVPHLFISGQKLMEPSLKYRNAIVHRDLWTNNIFLKKTETKVEALMVDFQTVVYCCPMVDLASLMYYNTDYKFRKEHTETIINLYYSVLKEELELYDISVDKFYNKETLQAAYVDSILFGITQACIILPVTVMDDDTRNRLYSDPKTTSRLNEVSRSDEMIEAAKDDVYRRRITELFDELVEKYVEDI